MIDEIIVGNQYRSAGGYLFIVEAIAAHGQDCSIPMVLYRNLEPTFDNPPGKLWTIEESILLKRFRNNVGE